MKGYLLATKGIITTYFGVFDFKKNTSGTCSIKTTKDTLFGFKVILGSFECPLKEP